MPPPGQAPILALFALSRRGDAVSSSAGIPRLRIMTLATQTGSRGIQPRLRLDRSHDSLDVVKGARQAGGKAERQQGKVL